MNARVLRGGVQPHEHGRATLRLLRWEADLNQPLEELDVDAQRQGR